jgi:hypothetical protein
LGTLAGIDALGAAGPARAFWRVEVVASTRIDAIKVTSASVDLWFLLLMVFTVYSSRV